MGTDPKLNEGRIYSTLCDESIPLSTDGWRALGQLVVLACYDRKVEREFFAEILNLVGETQASLDAVEDAMRMHHLLQVACPGEESKILSKVAQDSGKVFLGARRQLAAKFSLVYQCPTTEDKIS